MDEFEKLQAKAKKLGCTVIFEGSCKNRRVTLYRSGIELVAIFKWEMSEEEAIKIINYTLNILKKRDQ